MQLSRLRTEEASPLSDDLDVMPIEEALVVLNQADRTVPDAVSQVLPQIADAVRMISAALARGGRLVYLGAGTSGRLGLLDAVECPPTFGTAPSQVVAVMAGGGALWPEAIGVAAYTAVAVIGFRTSLWLVAAALLAHGVFDLVHPHMIDNPGVPRWWPAFCLAFDAAAAGYLAVRLLQERQRATPA